MDQELPLEQRLREIRQQFQKGLQSRVERIADLWSRLQSGWSDEVASGLYAEFHRMHGSCGTLGFLAVSEIACELQTIVRDAQENKALPDTATQARISHLIDSLARNCVCDE